MQVNALNNKIKILNAKVNESDDEEPTGQETGQIFTSCSAVLEAMKNL